MPDVIVAIPSRFPWPFFLSFRPTSLCTFEFERSNVPTAFRHVSSRRKYFFFPPPPTITAYYLFLASLSKVTDCSVLFVDVTSTLVRTRIPFHLCFLIGTMHFHAENRRPTRTRIYNVIYIYILDCTAKV